MKRTPWLKFTLAALLFGVVTSARAQGESPEELDIRQRNATEILNDVSAIERSAGYYRTAVENYFYGERGIKTEAERWLGDSHAWITDMLELTTILKVTDEQSFTEAASTIERTFQEKMATLDLLAARAQVISRSCERLEKLSQKSAATPLAMRADLKPVSEAIANFRTRAGEAAGRIQTAVDGRLSDLRIIATEGRRILLGRLKGAMLQAGLAHMEAALQRVADATAYELEVMPLVKELEALELALGIHVTELAYYQAAEGLAAIRGACAAFPQRLAQARTSEYLKSQALARKNVVCDAAEGHWSDLNALGVSPADLVWEYSRVKEAVFKHECRTERPQINCEKLAVLRAIPRDRVKDMDPAELKFYEQAWTELAKGL